MSSLDEKLSSRDVLADLFLALEALTGAAWIQALTGNPLQSMKEEEVLRWLGQVPQMREWVGERQAKGLTDQEYTIRKKLYEATLKILVDDLRRDRYGMVETRINELAERSATHWASLISPLILNGESTTCYDGQFYFDTDHEEGSSGTQSNDITVDISTLPIASGEFGTTNDPSPKTMKHAIQHAITQMYTFVDDQGEPMNETAMQFMAMVPVPFMTSAAAAVSNTLNNEDNDLAQSNFEVNVVGNPRLSAWTDKFALFRTDAQVPPLLRLEDPDGIQVEAIAEGSELAFNQREHHYGLSGWRAAGYGYWQHACLVQLT